MLEVDLSPLQVGDNATYTSDQIMSELLSALADVVHDATLSLIQRASFVGIMVDETTDISNISQLGIHLCLVHKGTVTSRFGSLQALSNTTCNELTKVVTDWCGFRGINLRRLHLGTDGAVSFTGRHKGVARLLKGLQSTSFSHSLCMPS